MRKKLTSNDIIEMIKKGVKDFSRIEAHGIDFSGLNLSGLNFEESDLSYSSFRVANLTNANFRKAKLEWVNFEFANLTNTNFEEAVLCWSKFNNAFINGTNFRKADLSWTLMFNVDLSNANTEDAIMFKVATDPSQLEKEGHELAKKKIEEAKWFIPTNLWVRIKSGVEKFSLVHEVGELLHSYTRKIFNYFSKAGYSVSNSYHLQVKGYGEKQYGISKKEYELKSRRKLEKYSR